MKKLFIFLVLAFAFNACTKEEQIPLVEQEVETVYFYIEAVDLDGTITTTQIVPVRYKPE